MGVHAGLDTRNVDLHLTLHRTRKGRVATMRESGRPLSGVGGLGLGLWGLASGQLVLDITALLLLTQAILMRMLDTPPLHS